MQRAESERLDLLFAALASPVRRSILDTIASGRRTVAELAEPHAISLNAVSKHIKYLEKAGLVDRSVDGNYHRISMNEAALNEAAAWLAHYAPIWRRSLRGLKSYVEAE